MIDELLNKIKEIIPNCTMGINKKDKESFMLLSDYLKENKELIHFENSIYDAENEILFKGSSNDIFCYLLTIKEVKDNIKNLIEIYDDEIEKAMIRRDENTKILKKLIDKTNDKNIKFDSKGWEIPKGN